ncbi:MAG: MFS transporter, partial [Flavobacteriales bacterium]
TGERRLGGIVSGILLNTAIKLLSVLSSLWLSIRNAYGGLSRAIWLLALAQFINRAGSMVVFFMAVYLRDDVGLDLAQVGVVMACYGVGALVGVYAGGKLTDRIGHQPVMVGSLLGGFIMFMLASQVDGFYALCIVMFLLSAFGDGFRPAGMVAISHYSNKDNYTRSVSLYRLAINLGFSIGPAIGGLLAAIDYQYLFWADGGTCLMASVFVYFFLPSSSVNHQDSEVEGSAVKSEERTPWKDRAFLIFLPLVTIYAIAFFQLFSTMSLYYKNHEGFTEGQIGGILALNGFLVAAVELVLVSKIEHRGSIYRWIIWGTLMLTASYGLILFLHGIYWYLFIITIVSFSEMFVMPFTNTFMNSRSGKANRGQYASLFVMAWSAAHVFTPIIATNIMESMGYAALWWVMIGFTLVVVGLTMWVKRAVASD